MLVQLQGVMPWGYFLASYSLLLCSDFYFFRVTYIYYFALSKQDYDTELILKVQHLLCFEFHYMRFAG